MTKLPLSVVVNTRNSAETLALALASVPAVAELIVVDMHSSDATKKIARTFKATIFDHPDTQYVEPARNFAISKATQDWIFVLDADEQVSAALYEKLPEIISRAEQENNVCVYLPRKNFIFGEWVRHTGWWPDHLPRLFKKGAVDWPEKIHALPQVKGTSWCAPASELYCIEHQNYTTVSQYVERMNRYTTTEVKDTNVPQVFSVSQSFTTFFSEFLRRFFLQEGFRDGVRGSSLSLLQSTYQLLTFLKLWEQADHQEEKETHTQTVDALRTVTKQCNYWIADFHVQRSRGFSKVYWQLRRKFQI
ncbi:glycosyltransferase family 2 protein [Candidatus Woesebacteria bacterium]|nr:glycosyltransferase family 2 protein [Candidatus Woesebacteria bacterium]